MYAKASILTPAAKAAITAAEASEPINLPTRQPKCQQCCSPAEAYCPKS